MIVFNTSYYLSVDQEQVACSVAACLLDSTSIVTAVVVTAPSNEKEIRELS